MYSKFLMKNIPGAIVLVLLFASCRNSPKPVVDPGFADSLVSHYAPSPSMRATDDNTLFWQQRMAAQPENFVNGPKYASALASRFRLHGDITDLRRADSLLQRSNEANQGKEPNLWRS